MRALFLTIIALFVGSLSAQSTSKIQQASSITLDQTFLFIVPAGPTADALEKIEAATNLYFSYNPDIIPKTVKNDTWVGISLRQGLDKMLGQNFAFRLKGNHIIIRTLQEGIINNGKQEYAITGYIRNNKTGKSIPFASVYDTTSLKSVLSERDGYFELTVSDTLTKTIGILIPNQKDTYLLVSPLRRIETNLSSIIKPQLQTLVPITKTIFDTLSSYSFWNRQIEEIHEINKKIEQELITHPIQNKKVQRNSSLVQLAMNYGSIWPWMPEMQIGIPQFYNRFTFAPGQNRNHLWGVGYGIGTQIGTKNDRSLAIEVLAMGLYPGHVAEIPLMGTVSVLPTFKLGKNVKIIVGPEANALFTHGIKVPEDGYKLPPQKGITAKFPLSNGREMTAFFSWRVKLVIE